MKLLETCKFCTKKLRKDNQIGTCRQHRAMSDDRISYMAFYKEQNLDVIRDYTNKWSKENRQKLSRQQLERYRLDINFKLGINLRNRLHKALAKTKRTTNHIKELGCSIEYLKTYLESQFSPGMTWENHTKDGWHIDHIRPLCNFDLTDKKQLEEACHYKNLRPLWSTENLSRPKRPKLSHECPAT